MPSTNIDWDQFCVCGSDGWTHICEDPQCPKVGEHTERCADCDCPDFMSLDTISTSAKQASLGDYVDVERHESVDMNVRGVDIGDIKAAIRDQIGREWDWDEWNWRVKF